MTQTKHNTGFMLLVPMRKHCIKLHCVKKNHMSCAALHKALAHTDQQAMTVSKRTSVK